VGVTGRPGWKNLPRSGENRGRKKKGGQTKVSFSSLAMRLSVGEGQEPRGGLHRGITMKTTLIGLLLLLAGDVEQNPGPPKAREPKPDPKKIMEDKVNSHDEKIGKEEGTMT